MRQPQVAGRLLTVVAALVLVAPVVVAVRALVVSVAFLAEFLTDGALPVLTTLTPAPLATAVDANTDRYRPGGLAGSVPLVLVHGLTPEGKDDSRLQRAARLFARAGFDVVVPTIAGLTRGRLRPDDAQPVVAALASHAAPAHLVSVSVGAAPAFLAAADPAVAARVRRLWALGPHASALELIRFHLTGEYAWNSVQGRVPPDPALSRALIEANAELADPELRQALATGDARRVDAALAALPERTRNLIAEVSPVLRVAAIQAPIVLVHGRADPAVPYSESLRLAAARPAHTRVVLVGAIGHVEGASGVGSLLDLARLLGVVYELVTLD